MTTSALFDIPLPELSVAPHELSAYVPCYNEALRLPYFLEHHRRLGVTRFFVVDNGSTDGTTEILQAAPDVVWLPSRLSYRDYRQQWRNTICEHYLTDRWVLALDVDELFMYPGWPEVSGVDLIAQLDRDGYQCLFTTMVDMYSAGPIGDVRYKQGDPFLETSPYFDTSGYRYTPGSRKKAQLRSTPIGSVYGGPRERFFDSDSQQSGWLRRLGNRLFSMDRRWDDAPLRTAVVRPLHRLLRTAFPKLRPLMSKLPLVKWQRGYEYHGGVHVIKQQLRMSPQWGALLHFKYFQDFAAKVGEAVERGQHNNGAADYRYYQTRMQQLLTQSPLYEGSRRFEGARSLLDAGLMRNG